MTSARVGESTSRAPDAAVHWVSRELDLPAELDPWLSELESLGGRESTPRVPSPDEAADLLQRLGVGAREAAEVVATVPGPGWPDGMWWLLERCHRRILQTMSAEDAPRGSWPQLPSGLGVMGRCFPIHLFLATLPATLERHRQLGIPEDVTWATLADLGRHVSIYSHVHHAAGVDAPWWVTLHLRSLLFECGRLQYEPIRLVSGAEAPSLWYADAGAMDEGFRPGDPSVSVHIPASGPLAPSECDASFAQAGELMHSCFAPAQRRLAVCESWLLDDQLLEYLPPHSNIVRFQQRFELVPGYNWTNGDDNIRGFVFRDTTSPWESLPGSTTLERAVKAHVASGRHWRSRTGWTPLP